MTNVNLRNYAIVKAYTKFYQDSEITGVFSFKVRDFVKFEEFNIARRCTSVIIIE